MTGASQAKLTHNFPRSLLETAHKRRNCNDVNSRFEVVPGELRAKLLDEWPGLVLWAGCFEGCWLLLVVLCPLVRVLVG